MSGKPAKPAKIVEVEPALRDAEARSAGCGHPREILAAAETLFLRDGYVRTSMKAIAAHAGVSEKTMYLAFATKATLLRQVIQLTVQGDEAAHRCPSVPNGGSSSTARSTRCSPASPR